jgi:PAS domain S-box-containing protein
MAEHPFSAAVRLAAIVESSDDAIIGKTLDGKIIAWNDAATRLFGYTADEMIGKSILTLLPLERHSEETTIIATLVQAAASSTSRPCG